MAGAYQSPDTYVTYFPSSNEGTVELYRKHGSHTEFVIRLNDRVVAVTDKHLAFHWLLALVQPEHHGDVHRLYMEM
ncbi:hypothetical protein F7731_23825 [Cytobacillus depressus]|uniref:Uncharacterized protein n=1 Tax=Cytobacillus depressus TaxID=1602942 RepID=A0A6L3UXZ5_9BACI|nr:hypothetical protein [Cytobacillus depressus]KAB2328982.1 hypothetical protein F7731_23825 [Cytobacillus depressus]